MYRACLFVLLTLSSLGCSEFSRESLALPNLDNLYSKVKKNALYREDVGLMRDSLENILSSHATDDFSFQSREEKIRKEAENLGFSTQIIGESLVVALDPKKEVTQNRIFFFNGDMINLSEEEKARLREQSKTMSIIFGQGSLYPGGVLVSLLYAWKALEKENIEAARKIQLIFAKNNKILTSSLSSFESTWSQDAVLIVPLPERYGISKKEGHFHFNLRLPIDRTVVKDITTKDNIAIVTYISLDKDKSPTVQNFPLFSSQNNPLREQGKQDFRDLVNSLRGRFALTKEQLPALSHLLDFLSSWSRKRVSLKAPLTSLKLLSISTSGGSVDFSFDAFLTADFLLQKGETFQKFLENYMKDSIFSSLEKTNNGYKVISSDFSPSYTISSDPRTQMLYNQAADAFSYVYHLPISYFPKQIEGSTPFLGNMKDIPVFFMGFFLGSPKFYIRLGYIPELKLFLDKKYLVRFLSQSFS